MDTKRLIMYTRVSGKGQVKDSYGLSLQRADCRDWAKANGWRITAHPESDDGITGTAGADVVEGIGARDANGTPEHLAERPGLAAAIAAVQDGSADGIIVGKLDRLGRATHVQEAALNMVWRAGGTVVAADRGIVPRDDPDDPMRTAMRKVFAVFDELDKAIAVKRMRDGRLAKAAEGKHAVGRLPFGYRSGGKGHDKAPEPSEAAAAARIRALRSEGQSYRAIIATLDAEGIRPRSAERWSPSTVRSICLRDEG